MKGKIVASVLTVVLLSTSSTYAQEDKCDPSYTDVYIAPYPPDLNCGDIPHKDITVFTT
jgi:hypothetical protein